MLNTERKEYEKQLIADWLKKNKPTVLPTVGIKGADFFIPNNEEKILKRLFKKGVKNETIGY